jgi:5-methylcytosine-specific restriction enzyme subunit McrC
VGDAKYKNLTSHRVPNSDLYQMLSYATALDLPGGLLVYALGEVDDASYEIRHSGKRLDVASLNIAGTLDETLRNVRTIAQRVVLLRDEPRGVRL